MVENILNMLKKKLGLCNICDISDMFIYGGCYIFAKKFQSAYGGILYFNKNKEHCIIKLDNKFYDAKGLVQNINGYKICSPNDEYYMEDSYGLDDWYSGTDMNWLLN